MSNQKCRRLFALKTSLLMVEIVLINFRNDKLSQRQNNTLYKIRTKTSIDTPERERESWKGKREKTS